HLALFPLSLHDALPIWTGAVARRGRDDHQRGRVANARSAFAQPRRPAAPRRGPLVGDLHCAAEVAPSTSTPVVPVRRRSRGGGLDRKSTRLNSSHLVIS